LQAIPFICLVSCYCNFQVIAFASSPNSSFQTFPEDAMPRIENEPKLDFKDVLLRPKRSTLKSRADVDLVREYVFRNSKKSYSGVPVIASNMDTVGTFEMAEALLPHKLFTTIHKHYSVEEWKEFHAKFRETPMFNNIAVSSGISDRDLEKLRDICAAVPDLDYICIDVANGYSECFIDFIRKVREEYPRHTIMAGNVVTGEMVEELLITGADIIKVGIGPGSVCTTRKKAGVGYPQLSAKFKLFYGMSSDTAMNKHHGSVAEYRASEGKTITIPYRGDVNATVQDILGGIRSACTYTGAAKLKELSKRTTFIRVTQQTNDMYVPYEV
ncbi:putative GMP reductase, partial [Ancylostoma caninum]